MRQKIISILLTIVYIIGFVFVGNAFSYIIPPKESNIKYLYVFGKDGKKAYGAIEGPQVVFLRVPLSYTGKVRISIYDPDIGGTIDEKSGVWDTEMRFYVYGGDKAYSGFVNAKVIQRDDIFNGVLLGSMTFGKDKAYNRNFYNFSEIDANKGESVDGFRYFKVVAEGLTGDDNNIFALDVSPDNMEAFMYIMPIRLSETRGDIMWFYPEIPSSVSSVTEHNYDLDKYGGQITLMGQDSSYKIKGSDTGAWASTKISVSPNTSGKRWIYQIIKGTQPNANMAIKFTTSEGVLLPLFFDQGQGFPRGMFADEPPLADCKTFTFDGSKSYDPDNQKLSYLWDFGDGTTNEQVKNSHTYKEAGKYLVQLTVIDNSEVDCNAATAKHIVKVNEPPKAVAKGVSISCIDNEVFFDASDSTDAIGDKLTYIWDFDDGETEQGIKVSHKYQKGGKYQVSLTVKDDSGASCDTDIATLGLRINTPPVADVGEDIVMCKKNPADPLEVVFDASKSKDFDGDKLTYIWDFGDGKAEEGKIVAHRYEKGGKYNVQLLVTDSSGAGCDTATATKVVTLNRSPLANAGKDMNICLSEEAKFDGTASLDNDGNNISCTWDFGDGETATGLNTSHIYKKGGLYKVELSVDDGTGTECARSYDLVSVAVNSQPLANLKANDNICLGTAVEFDGSLSEDPDGDKLTYSWDFGDGITATGANVQHDYEKGGLYKALLTVQDGKNSKCSSSSREHYVKVNTPPVASAGPDKVVCVDKAVNYNGSLSFDKDNDKLKYTWEFGDGSVAEGVKISHTYKTVGVYKVTLTVSDDSGSTCNTSVDTIETTVNAQPVPVIEVI